MQDHVGTPIGVMVHERDYEFLIAYMYTKFDEDCTLYEQQYESIKGQIKYVKKYLWVKTLLFPLELTIAYLLLGKAEVRARMIHQRKIWKGLKAKHLSLEQINELYELC